MSLITLDAMDWRGSLPWIIGALLVVLAVLAYLLLTAPPDNPLPQVYDVL